MSDLTEFLRYANGSAVRNQPLNPRLVDALGFLPELGVMMEVFSGGQPASGPGRTGSHRHDHGNSADAVFYKDGRKLSWDNPADVPLYQEIVKRGRANGLTGFGAGPGYMQPGSMHLGFGKPGVWGASGSGANAPEWLRTAFEGMAGAQPIPNYVPKGDPMAGAVPIPTVDPSKPLPFMAAGGDPTRMSLDNTQMSGTDLLQGLQRGPTGQTVSPKAENGPPEGVFYYDSGNSDALAPKIDPKSVEFSQKPAFPDIGFSPAPATPDIWSPPVIDRQLSRGDPSDNPAFPPQPRPNMSRMANVPQPVAKPSPGSIVPTGPAGPPDMRPARKDDALLEALLSGGSRSGGGGSAGIAPRPEMDLGEQGPIVADMSRDPIGAIGAPEQPGSDLGSLGAILAQILQQALAPQLALRERQAAGLV